MLYIRTILFFGPCLYDFGPNRRNCFVQNQPNPNLLSAIPVFSGQVLTPSNYVFNTVLPDDVWQQIGICIAPQPSTIASHSEQLNRRHLKTLLNWDLKRAQHDCWRNASWSYSKTTDWLMNFQCLSASNQKPAKPSYFGEYSVPLPSRIGIENTPRVNLSPRGCPYDLVHLG